VIRLVASAAVTVLANAVALIAGALLLEDMGLDVTGFILAVLIFTGVSMLASPLIRRTALTKAPVLLGSTALISTLAALIVTAIISDGLRINGLTTWVLAVVVVWAIGLAGQVLLPFVIFKKILRASAEQQAARVGVTRDAGHARVVKTAAHMPQSVSTNSRCDSSTVTPSSILRARSAVMPVSSTIMPTIRSRS